MPIIKQEQISRDAPVLRRVFAAQQRPYRMIKIEKRLLLCVLKVSLLDKRLLAGVHDCVGL